MDDHTPNNSNLDDPKSPLLLPIQSPNGSLQPSNTHYNFKSILSVASGPLACTIICLALHLDGHPTSARNMLGVLSWVFLWWITEAVPLPITSMAPLFLFPIFGIAKADVVAESYMDDVIVLVLGSLILALAVEHYNMHRRLALNITLIFCGEPLNPQLLLLGICATTLFVSMWMQNAAATMMMIPVATGIIQRFPESHDGESDTARFCKAVVLGVIYSAAIGGMSTLTGTATNLVWVGMWHSYFPNEEPIYFSTWFFFGFPLALVIFFAMWGILCFFYCSKSSGIALAPYMDKAHLKRELELLGPMSFAEKMVLAIFSMLVVLWMTRHLTDDIPGWGGLFHGRVGDGTVSVMMATLLFIIPNKKQEGEKLMDWNKCRKLPWNIVLFVGAGFAIADGMRTSGLADVLSAALNFLEIVPYLAIAPAVCLVSSTITEFMLNNATTTLVIPILIQLAGPMHVHPLLLMVPGAMAAQFSFVLPTGTPSNIIGFATGHIQIKDMIKIGFPLKIAGIMAVTILMPTLVRALRSFTASSSGYYKESLNVLLAVKPIPPKKIWLCAAIRS